MALLESGERFDLLFTDIGLPDGLLGPELAKMAERRQPWLKVLFATGYAKVLNDGGEGPIDPARVLRKPYRGDELVEKVRAVLGAPGPSDQIRQRLT